MRRSEVCVFLFWLFTDHRRSQRPYITLQGSLDKLKLNLKCFVVNMSLLHWSIWWNETKTHQRLCSWTNMHPLFLCYIDFAIFIWPLCLSLPTWSECFLFLFQTNINCFLFLSHIFPFLLPFRVLLGLQCFWDRHRPALRMDEGARYIGHILLAHPHRHYPVGASVTLGQSWRLHDVLNYVPGDDTLWGAWGEVWCTLCVDGGSDVKMLRLISSIKFAGILGSAFQHRGRSWRRRTVEGKLRQDCN